MRGASTSALHPANIFAPPKILDKKAAQGASSVFCFAKNLLRGASTSALENPA